MTMPTMSWTNWWMIHRMLNPMTWRRPILTLTHEAVEHALGRVDALIEQIGARPQVTPLNAATQTPAKFAPSEDRTPMLVESDGERSVYEEHFTQSLAKDDKARKLANRTPEVEVTVATKTGKKQKKQLQFTQSDPTLQGAKGDVREKSTSTSRGVSRLEEPPKKTKDQARRADLASPLHTTGSQFDKRKGKETLSTHSPGK
ncbi:unnamed protein product [Calypogeia fissa]